VLGFRLPTRKAFFNLSSTLTFSSSSFSSSLIMIGTIDFYSISAYYAISFLSDFIENYSIA